MSVPTRTALVQIPTCATCGADLLDGEGYVPTFESEAEVADTDPVDLTCPNCHPIRLVPTDPTPYTVTFDGQHLTSTGITQEWLSDLLAGPRPTLPAPAFGVLREKLPHRRPVPGYVMCLLEAWATGGPVNFADNVVPSGVRELVDDVVLSGGPGPALRADHVKRSLLALRTLTSALADDRDLDDLRAEFGQTIDYLCTLAGQESQS